MENPQVEFPADKPDEALLVPHLESRIERERRAIEREIHDEVSGMLAAARMDVSFLRARVDQAGQFKEHFERLDHALDRAIRATRKIMQALRPALLDHFGLPVALKHHVDELTRACALPCQVQLPEDFDGVDPELQIAAFRVVQELLGDGSDLTACSVEMFESTAAYRLELGTTRKTAPIPNHRETPALAALRIWIVSLGGSWTTRPAGSHMEIHTVGLPRTN